MVIKPRNSFTDGALRRLVPQTNIAKKKSALSMSLMNIGSGRGGSGLFKRMSGLQSVDEEGRH